MVQNGFSFKSATFGWYSTLLYFIVFIIKVLGFFWKCENSNSIQLPFSSSSLEFPPFFSSANGVLSLRFFYGPITTTTSDSKTMRCCRFFLLSSELLCIDFSLFDFPKHFQQSKLFICTFSRLISQGLTGWWMDEPDGDIEVSIN